ncbi:hypothetical protein T12_2805 [Trichinella patagoniensis]|uniref:Uncharacterized protein n=1 Tax=Trichinella patagoniensis TaxID=990121 RepID=A0A0V0Z5D8_9BILA|nr:hypothetical protein T12_2805 [Trichinella patagoniensis]
MCADSNCTEEKATASVVGQPPKLIKLWSKLPLYSKYFNLYERKENCLWNSLCNLLVLFLFLRMSISQSIFFCKTSDVCLIDKIYKPIEKNISKIISTVILYSSTGLN